MHPQARGNVTYSEIMKLIIRSGKTICISTRCSKKEKRIKNLCRPHTTLKILITSDILQLIPISSQKTDPDMINYQNIPIMQNQAKYIATYTRGNKNIVSKSPV